MILETYQDNKHREILALWLKQRQIPDKWLDEMPALGMMAFEDAEAVAVGFIRNCEGSIAIFDSFLSNPKIAAQTRNLALDMLVDELYKICKPRFLHFWIITRDKNTIIRAQKHGAELSDFTFLMLSLGKSDV